MVKFLEKCDTPKTRLQIARSLDCNPENISRILRDLLKWSGIKFVEHNREEASKRVGYVLLRRTKFYFVEKDD